MQPYFSIVIPAYNAVKVLQSCVDSLIHQTFSDIEIILVDDGSTDGTDALIDEYSRKDARIKALHHEKNKSVLCGLKTGIAVTTGRYILLGGADDEFTLGACDILHCELEKDPVDILHFSMELRNCANLPADAIAEYIEHARPIDGSLYDEDIFENCFVEKGHCWEGAGKAFNGSLFRRVFSEIEEGYFNLAEDAYSYFLTTYYAKSYRGIPDAKLYIYNFGLGGTGHNIISLKTFQNYCTVSGVLERLNAFLLQNNSLILYRRGYEVLYDIYVSDCCWFLKMKLNNKDKVDGLKLLTRSFALKDLVPVLAKTYWDSPGDLAKLILESSDFVFEGNKQIQTIGILAYSAHDDYAILLQRVAELLVAAGYKTVLITEDTIVEKGALTSFPGHAAVIPSVLDPVYESDEKWLGYDEHGKALSSVIQNEQIDSLLLTFPASNSIFWDLLTCYVNNVPTIAIMMESFTGDLSQMRRSFRSTPNILPLVSSVLVRGEEDERYWSRYNGHVYCIPCKIDFSREVHSSDDEKNDILWQGVPCHRTQPLEAIYIFNEVLKRRPETMCTMVIEEDGDDAENVDALCRYLEAYNIADKVKIVLKRGNTLGLYGTASILLATSRMGEYPFSIQAAAACGVPCVVYELPYYSLVKNNDGTISVSQNHPSLAADVIVDLLANNEALDDRGRRNMDYYDSLPSLEDEMEVLVSAVAQSSLPFSPRPFSSPDDDIRMLEQTAFYWGVDDLTRERNAACKGSYEQGRIDAQEVFRQSHTFRIGNRLLALPRFLKHCIGGRR